MVVLSLAAMIGAVCVYVHGHYITRMYVRGGSVVVLGRA